MKCFKIFACLFVLLVINLTFSIADSSAVCLDPPAGMVSWWPGDGNAHDIIGGNDGILVDGTTYAPGMVDQAFSFDGKDDYVQVPVMNIDDLGRLTIDAWVKHNSLPDRTGWYVSFNDQKAVLRYDGVNGPRQLHFYMTIDGVRHHIRVNDILQVGVFHHVAGSYDGSYMRLYLDGVEIGSLEVSGTVGAGTWVALGSHDRALDGLLDEVEIYHRALSVAEIKAIYDAGSEGKCKIDWKPKPVLKEVYDAFSGPHIDSKKWKEREFVREVVGGKLVSKLSNYPATEIGPGLFRNSTPFQNPESINIIECEITIVATNLPSGNEPSSFGRIGGMFYNVRGSGGATGDIWAEVLIGDRGNGGLEAYWVVEEILDDNVTSSKELGNGTLIPAGTLNYGTPYIVKLAYDGNKGFLFTVAGVSDTFSGPDRQAPAGFLLKGLITGIDSDGGSGIGYVHALFDDVHINNEEAPYDDFSTEPLDPTKWKALEIVRETSGGRLRLNVQGCDDVGRNSVALAAYDTRYIEAKVLIESGSQVPSGNDGWARIAGWYYNDSRGPGSGLPYNGYEGDVWITNRLGIDSEGQLEAVAAVWRSDDADATTGPSLLWQPFPTPINFNTEYILSIEFTGSSIIFKCNNDILRYKVTTPIYDPSEKWLGFQSRVYVDPGECGYIKGRIDDVFVYKEVKLSPGIPLLLLAD